MYLCPATLALNVPAPQRLSFGSCTGKLTPQYSKNPRVVCAFFVGMNPRLRTMGCVFFSRVDRNICQTRRKGPRAPTASGQRGNCPWLTPSACKLIGPSPLGHVICHLGKEVRGVDHGRRNKGNKNLDLLKNICYFFLLPLMVIYYCWVYVSLFCQGRIRKWKRRHGLSAFLH